MNSVLNMLKIAAMPLGKTMYIYGGGWNDEDTGAGVDCLSYGISPKWVAFANTRGADYNHKSYNYRRDKSVTRLGLDCSAYVGWVLFNTLRDGRDYVVKSTAAVKRFADMGLGRRIPRDSVTVRRAGDIMSAACGCCAHVYICVGECGDGSLVLLHSSPNGVQISGTAAPTGNEKSEAVAVAKWYMCRYYPRWMSRYPHIQRGTDYLTHYEQLEMTSLADVEDIRSMSADKVLEYVFNKGATN